ncbi:MAG: OmpA family protein [Chitinispirillales bacterium]|jgi:hypothetical protein|nr:OmpA family protein [Chitinispirillales bacterium]
MMKKNTKSLTTPIATTLITAALLCAAISVAAYAQGTTQNPDATELPAPIRTINFRYQQTALPLAAHSPLDSIVALFRRNLHYHFEIHGHTCAVGAHHRNIRAATLRAAAVKDYLVASGIPAESIITIVHGPDLPTADNTTPQGRARNRRVEVKLAEIPQPEPEPIIEIVEPEPVPEPCLPTECEPCPPIDCGPCLTIEDITTGPKTKTRINVGIAGFFSSDFGGGFNKSEINIGSITIPGTEVKTPWIGGGVKGFFDVTNYAEVGVGLTFGNGVMEMPNPASVLLTNESPTIEVEHTFLALNLSLLGKYPIVNWPASDNTLFLAAGIDYQLVLSGKIGEVNIINVADDNALWFKFGVGMDMAISETVFIRPTLQYGIRRISRWESGAMRPVITDGEKGLARLGHGFTFSVGIGFKL